MSKRRRNKRRKAKQRQRDRNVVQFQEQPKQEYTEVASWSSDPDVYGFDDEILLNPDWVPGENGYTDTRIYERLWLDALVRTGLEKRALQVVCERYEFVPGGEKRRDKEAAANYHHYIGGNFPIAQKEAIQFFLLCGYSVQEVLPESIGGSWRLTKWHTKKPWRFVFTPERELRLLTKEAPFYGVPLPTDRPFVVISWDGSDNPYGRGLGQALWEIVRMKILIKKFWALYVDKWTMPTGWGKYTPTGDEGKDLEKKRKLLEAIRHMRSNSAVATPVGDFIELLEAKRAGRSDFEAVLGYLDKETTILIQHQTLTTSSEGIGSDGGYRTHDDVAHMTKQFTAIVHEYGMIEAVKFIHRWNYPENVAPPIFRWITEKESVLKELAERDIALVNGLHLKVDADYFYEKYNIPIPKGGGGFVQPAQQVQPPATGGQQASFASPYSPEQQALEAHAKEAVKSVDLSYNEDLILQFVQGYDGELEDLFDDILDVHPDMDAKSLQFAYEIVSGNGYMHGRRVVQLDKEKAVKDGS